jgi:uncharacterized membrane protein YgcG
LDGVRPVDGQAAEQDAARKEGSTHHPGAGLGRSVRTRLKRLAFVGVAFILWVLAGSLFWDWGDDLSNYVVASIFGLIAAWTVVTVGPSKPRRASGAYRPSYEVMNYAGGHPDARAEEGSCEDVTDWGGGSDSGGFDSGGFDSGGSDCGGSDN